MRIFLLFIAYSSLLFSASLPLLFSGNDRLSSRELYDVLGLRLPYAIEVWENQPTLQSSAISQSITALTSYYRAKGYFESRITADETNQSITFTIHENLPIRVATIQINSEIAVESVIELSTDKLFDQDKFAATKTAIKKRYGDAGYCNATFNSKAWVDLEEHQAHLLFEGTPNEPCTFGAIAVSSTPNIDGNLTTSMLQFKEGDPYTLEAIQKSYETLYSQEGISRVSINDIDRNGSIVPIAIDIEEIDKPVRFNIGLGYSSDEGIGTQIGLKHRNFLGDLKTLSLDAKYTQVKQEASGILSIPLQERFTASGEVGYSNEQFSGYRSESVFEKLTLKHQDIPTSLLTSVLFDQAKTYESTNTETFPNSNLFILSPMLEINYDTRNKMLEPTKGDWINAKVQGSMLSSISDATYFKSSLSGAHIQSFGEHVIAGRLQWGTLRTYEGEVPSAYRFYAGGMSSNRAYSYRELGPKDTNGDPIGFTSLLEGTLEYRFPIYDPIRGVLFSDLTYGSNNYIPDYSLPYWGVGAGLRYTTPIGPIAIDVGVNPTDYSQYTFHFRIGELF
ncbi:MAG: BamA/TamA family outer membrane protein [Sulfuricurvum sp.]|uniref:autotransporter assembly complex protein TamA n=1 Tax=Sulfuricurvum sp. TaxID=2025608 RepID=UPI00261E600F|nr:outer membrane protein assembly factor [Sulfuricurvum sp.]MDD2828338.1 BamA/TamA family outer membrane protein [Sulfuricurvum sp.]MDD4949343.1 BamA/TamA family outer membrane protein [Sulfuricurvum sp.]